MPQHIPILGFRGNETIRVEKFYRSQSHVNWQGPHHIPILGFGWDDRTHLGFGWDARTQEIFMEELEQWLIISGGPCKMIEEPLERVSKYLTYFGFFEIGITAFLPARASSPGQFLQSPKQKPIFGPVLYHPNLFFLGESKQ